jgi:hypothetical protein
MPLGGLLGNADEIKRASRALLRKRQRVGLPEQEMKRKCQIWYQKM